MNIKYNMWIVGYDPTDDSLKVEHRVPINDEWLVGAVLGVASYDEYHGPIQLPSYTYLEIGRILTIDLHSSLEYFFEAIAAEDT